MRYFIIANGTHDLTVAFDVAGISAYLPVGTTVSIKSLVTKWVGPRPMSVAASLTSGSAHFQYIHFDQSTTTPPMLFDQYSSGLCFIKCLLQGDGVNPFVYVSLGAMVTFSGCMWLNQNSAVSSYGGAIHIQGLVAVNTYCVVDVRDTFLEIYGSLISRNSDALIYGNFGGRAMWVYLGPVYCLNTGTVWYIEYGGMQIEADLGYGTVVDGKAPNTWFDIGMGARLLLSGLPAEALDPSYSFILGAVNPQSLPAVHFSYADLLNLYGGNYDFGWGCQVIRTD